MYPLCTLDINHYLKKLDELGESLLISVGVSHKLSPTCVNH